MRKPVRLSVHQLSQIGFLRAEKIMNISAKALIVSLIIGIFSSTILYIILCTLNPEGSRGFLPLNTRIVLFIMFVCFVIFASSVLAIFISSLIAIFHRTPQNSHRLQPIMINAVIIGLPILVTLFSVFVDYSSTRGWIMLIMGFIIFSSFIVTYPIYRHRLRIDCESLYKSAP